LDLDKSKDAGLAQQNSLCPAFSLRILRLAKGIARADTYYRLARWFDSSRWVVISSVPPFAVPVSVSRVRLKK